MSRVAKAAQKSDTSARFASSAAVRSAAIAGIANATPVMKNWERVMASVSFMDLLPTGAAQRKRAFTQAPGLKKMVRQQSWFRGRKIRRDAVVQREFHTQPGILSQHLRLHFGRILRGRCVGVPVGHVFLHEVDSPQIVRRAWTLMARNQNHRLERHYLIDRLCPFLPSRSLRHSEVDAIKNNVAGDDCLQRRDVNKAVARSIVSL